MQQNQTIPNNTPGHFEKPKFELADILNLYWQEYRARHNTSKLQQSVVWAIRNCRTSVLGGHI